jgi:urease accessory protein UreF
MDAKYFGPRPGSSLIRLLEQTIAALCQVADKNTFERYNLEHLYEQLHTDQIVSFADIARCGLTNSYTEILKYKKGLIRSTISEDDDIEHLENLDTLLSQLAML